MQITILVVLLIVAILLVANFIATLNGNNNLYDINNLLDEIHNNQNVLNTKVKMSDVYNKLDEIQKNLSSENKKIYDCINNRAEEIIKFVETKNQHLVELFDSLCNISNNNLTQKICKYIDNQTETLVKMSNERGEDLNKVIDSFYHKLKEIEDGVHSIYNNNTITSDRIRRMYEDAYSDIKQIYVDDKNRNADGMPSIKDEFFFKANFGFLKKLTDEQKKCINKMLEENIKLLTAKINKYLNNGMTAQQKTDKFNKTNNSDKNNNKSNNKSNNKNNNDKSKNKK